MRKGSEPCAYLGKTIPGRENSHCEGSDMGAFLAHLSKSKEASVAEFRKEKEKR